MHLEIGNCQKNQLRDLRVVVSEWRERECGGGGGFHFSVSLKERQFLKHANSKLLKEKTEKTQGSQKSDKLVRASS